MKKLGIIYIILLFISSDIPQAEIYELEDLAIIIEDNDLIIEEWNVTVKEKKSQKEIQEKLSLLKKAHTMQKGTDNNVTKYFADIHLKVSDMHVRYEIIIPHDHNYSSELVITIKGTNLNMTTIEEFKGVLTSVRNQFFTEKSNLFTCLITSKNGMIASDDFMRKMSKDLDLENISTQIDVINEVSHQETLYGYTTMWDNEVLIENKPLNVQIVIQKLKNEKQKVIIGTPLLITEY